MSTQEETETMQEASLSTMIHPYQHQNFHGKENEDGERWLTQVTHKIKAYKLSDEQALSFIISLLQGNAWDWYVGLGDDEKQGIGSLTHAFKEHYY